MSIFFMALSSKALGEVAFEAAVFPVIFAIDGEGFMAVGTDNGLFVFMLHEVSMGIPPVEPTFVAAEFLFFPSLVLFDGLSAVEAGVVVSQGVAADIGFQGIDGKVQLFGDLHIPQAFPPEFFYFCFLCIVHNKYLLLGSQVGGKKGRFVIKYF